MQQQPMGVPRYERLAPPANAVSASVGSSDTKNPLLGVPLRKGSEVAYKGNGQARVADNPLFHLFVSSLLACLLCLALSLLVCLSRVFLYSSLGLVSFSSCRFSLVISKFSIVSLFWSFHSAFI